MHPNSDFSSDLREIIKKHGIVDHIFTGISIDGSHVVDYSIGSDNLDCSNTDRIQRIIGCLEITKIDIVRQRKESSIDPDD